MNSKEFKEYITNKTDKINALIEKSGQLDFSMGELIDIIKEVYNDEEKVDFIKRFQKISIYSRKAILKSINNDKLKLQCMQESDLLEKFETFDFVEVINTLSDKEKTDFLYNDKSKSLFKLDEYDYSKIIETLENDSMLNLLEDKEHMISLIGNESYRITDFIITLQDEDKRFELADKYEMDSYRITDILKTCSDEKKKEVLLSGKYSLNNYNMQDILSEFDINNLLDFVQKNSVFLQESKIGIYSIIENLTEDKQVEFISRMDETNLKLEDKLKCLVVLNDEAKKRVDRTNMSERYVQALEMSTIKFERVTTKDLGKIIIDLDGDLEKYKGLDELISIRPQDVPIEKHDRLIELAKICPNLEVNDNLGLAYSTTNEFINAENWIKEVIDGIQPNWSDVQKIAYIDNKIGKKVSYTPDFETEVSDDASARALWRIVDSGYGVCNGIAQLEQYMLKHVGIETEMVRSKTHSFLKVKNINIPKKDGTYVNGDSLLDPTWNLTSHRYDAYPNLFLRNYEEIRKFDILKDGTDKACHRNDEEFLNPTIDIEKEVVREVYKSIGLAKENGHFPIEDMMKVSDEIARKNIPTEQKLSEQLKLLQEMHPDFDKCQNSTISILAGNILNHPEINYERLVVNRVYNKNDKNKTASVYVYCDIGNEQNVFFVAEPGTGEFIKINKENFIENYECYEEDMKKTKGIRPWEKGAKDIEKDLNQSSGKVANKEGDER